MTDEKITKKELKNEVVENETKDISIEDKKVEIKEEIKNSFSPLKEEDNLDTKTSDSNNGTPILEDKKQEPFKKPFKNNSFRKPKFSRKREKPEFDQKIINISRVTRVVKGGRRLSFRVDMVIGDKNGRVGIGTGKATDTTIAIEKAFNKAKKSLVRIKRTDNKSIPYGVKAKHCASIIEIIPNDGRGLVAGSTARNILELAGITDVTSKIFSKSKNKLNNAQAAFKALIPFSTKEDLSSKKKDTKKEGNRERSSKARKFRTNQNFNK